MTDLTPEKALQLIRGDVGEHFVTCSHIKGKDGRVQKPAKCNRLQQRLYDAYLWLQMRRLPIKLIVLKPRQSGGSEGTAELVYHHSRRFNVGGMMLADIHDRTDKIWQLFCRKGEPGMDLYEPYWGNRFASNTEKATITYKDEKGRKGTAIWDRGTANDTAAGASGTRHILWLSESARYAKSGAFTDRSVIGNALNSLPAEDPNVLVVAESTAEGAGGWHYDTFEGAVYLEDAQKGKFGNGWIRIFVGWHECDDYVLQETPANREYFDDEDGRWQQYTDDERAGVIRYGWTREQIAWRRKKIIGDLGGDVQLFKRDYPASPEEAWASSGSKRFNQVAVATMLKAAETLWERTSRDDPTAPRFGSLIDGPGGVHFMPSREDSWLWVDEPPAFGRAYSLVIDPMTGEQSAGSEKRDNHACGIIRAPYVDEKGGMLHEAKVAAVIHLPGGCQWDVDVLGDRAALLSRWYGRCIVIPEVNKATDLLVYLREHGCLIYTRPVRPDISNPSERRHTLGFLTTVSTRPLWVSAAAEAIREGTLECRYLPAVREMDTFILATNGKAEAAAGAHDDWVAMYGIGKLTMGACTRMMLPVVRSTPQRAQQRSIYGKGSAAIG